MEFTGSHNEYLKTVASLKDAKAREKIGKYVVEGAVMLDAAARAGLRFEAIVASESYRGPSFEAGRRYLVTDAVFRKLSDTVAPQGILAVVSLPKRPIRAPKGNAVVLDGIRDPGNLGTILRTCAAVGIGDAYLIGCVDPFNPKVIRSGMSGTFYTECFEATYDEISEYVLPTHDLIVADMGGENVFESPARAVRPFALVIGSEAHGVSSTLRALAARIVSIPMRNVESLNAAISAGILLYQLTFARSKKE